MRRISNPNLRRQAIGAWGELTARRYLQAKGYAPIGQNCRTPSGELDLVMRDGETVVFVEVKARTSGSYGLPEEAVTPAKQGHLIASAQWYMDNQPDVSGLPWRIDVIAIVGQPSTPPPEIMHFENALP